jgi:hypothetical protein
MPERANFRESSKKQKRAKLFETLKKHERAA